MYTYWHSSYSYIHVFINHNPSFYEVVGKLHKRNKRPRRFGSDLRVILFNWLTFYGTTKMRISTWGLKLIEYACPFCVEHHCTEWYQMFEMADHKNAHGDEK